LGAGLSGLSCLEFLHAHQIKCALNDSRDNVIDPEVLAKKYKNVELTLGRWDSALIEAADLILISPGIDPNSPEIAKYIGNQTEVIGDVELFCRFIDTPIVAVTGSNGKSTVVTALAHVGEALGKNVVLGGNVGAPILSQISDDVDCYILELSSFQLETIKSLRAKAAAVLNVSDDHLDRHQTIENYAAIKRRIYENSELALFNADDARTSTVLGQKQLTFGGVNSTANYRISVVEGDYFLNVAGEMVAPLASLPLAGIHNGLNYLAVLALGNSLGWQTSEMLPHLQTFKGLTHRCQVIDSRDGITWINDSKATNVGATIAAIEGIAPTIGDKNQLVIIAGGDGKGADFSPLAKLFKQYVEQVIVLGKDASAIADQAKSAIQVDSIEEAVETANSLTNAGDTVLLSPACASIDMFRNYAQRGQLFADAVQRLGGKVA